MNVLNFYTVKNEYVLHLQNKELLSRGFTRVPNIDYGKDRNEKFLCGIVLTVQEWNYFVPVTSFKEERPDNFLIFAENQKVVSSLRFNYMFPVPLNQIKIRNINDISDKRYKALVAQELKYCRKNAALIQKKAERTYKRVLLGKDIGLVHNSCDFLLLEEACNMYSENIII